MTWHVLETTSWSVVCIFVPLVLAMVAYALGGRGTRLVAGVAAAGMPAAALALLLQVARLGSVRYQIGGWGSPLGIELYADGLSVLLVVMTAVIGSAVSLYALRYFASGQQSFWPVWLLVWGALNALFLSADLFNLYVTLELLSLGSVTLIALSPNTAALAATFRYLILALMGSLLYLLGVALLYAQFGTLDIQMLGQEPIVTPAVLAAQIAMTLGLLLKTALVPLHFWLPAAHSAAPAPVSAVLSALIVKASFYLLVRLWLDVFAEPASIAIDQLFGLLGAAAIVWGSLQALRAERLKLLIAYSTVAQLGYLFLLFPLSRHADTAELALSAVVLFALSHGCAKAAAFMAAGAVMKTQGHDRIAELGGVAVRLPVAMFAFALAAVSLMGLPPSGGFSAKWLLLQAAFASGQWVWAVVIVLGGLLAAGYLFRVLRRCFQDCPHDEAAGEADPASPRLAAPALALALIACGLGFFGGPIAGLIESGTTFGQFGAAP